MPTVLVRAVFYDPSSLEDVPECDALGDEISNSCYNPMEDSFPVEPDAINRIIERALQMIGISFNISDDKVNNAQTENE